MSCFSNYKVNTCNKTWENREKFFRASTHCEGKALRESIIGALVDDREDHAIKHGSGGGSIEHASLCDGACRFASIEGCLELEDLGANSMREGRRFSGDFRDKRRVAGSRSRCAGANSDVAHHAGAARRGANGLRDEAEARIYDEVVFDPQDHRAIRPHEPGFQASMQAKAVSIRLPAEQGQEVGNADLHVDLLCGVKLSAGKGA